MDRVEFLLGRITRAGDDCGCSFPCQCSGDAWEEATIEGMKDTAYEALQVLEKNKVTEEELLNIYGQDQSVDFVQTQPVKTDSNLVVVPGDTHKKEFNKLRCCSHDLWAILEDNGCFVAGGAVTSVFTGKPVNDLDVYFPSKEAFSKVMAEIYAHDNIGFGDARMCHITDRSILLTSDEQDVQFIVFKFFDSVQDIFNSFDFTAVMGAYDLAKDQFVFHPDFFKHNSQRFLKFNKGTDYPLISMLRVDKYRERGYTTSKQEMLKIGMAINAKNFDSWEKVRDEVGGLYGLDASEVFNTEIEFSIDAAIDQLDNLFIPKHYKNMDVPYDLFELAKKMPTKLSDSVLEYVEANKDIHSWSRKDYFEFIKEKETK